MATIMREGNWTHFRDGGRWHYTPPYEGPKNPLAPYKGHPPRDTGGNDLRQYGNPRIGPRGTLPGPGPQAGGRYHWYGPQPNPGMPTPFKNPYNKFARGLGLAGKLARKLSPVGRALDVGFQLLDLWQQTDPGNPQGGYDFGPASMNCCFQNDTKDALTTVALSSTPCGLGSLINCGLSGQLYSQGFPHTPWVYGDPIPTNTTTRYMGVYLGRRHGLPSIPRMVLREIWWLDRGPTGPYPTSIPWKDPSPAVTQPMPANLTPPQSYPDPYPRERTRPRTRPRAGVRTKPAPYNDGNTPTPGRTLPKPGEKKWKFPDYGIPGEIYGWLTEIKDGLKCFEKNLRGHRIPKGGGLHERIYMAAQYAYLHPDRLDGAGFIKCMIANHFEDKLIGKANQLANKITQSPYWQRPVGVGAGNWSLRM